MVWGGGSAVDKASASAESTEAPAPVVDEPAAAPTTTASATVAKRLPVLQRVQAAAAAPADAESDTAEVPHCCAVYTLSP